MEDNKNTAKKTNGENNFSVTMNSILGGIQNVFNTKTVVGEPLVVGDMTIIPLVDVIFAVGAGAKANSGQYNKGLNKNSNSAGCMGGKLTPSAVLVIKGDHVKLVDIKDQNTATKIMDRVPEIIDRISSLFTKKSTKSDDVDLSEDIDDIIKKSKTEF